VKLTTHEYLSPSAGCSQHLPGGTKELGNNKLCQAPRTFGLQRQEVKSGCRKLLIEELHNLYSSSHIVRMITVGG
jgi:hypothetical protein